MEFLEGLWNLALFGAALLGALWLGSMLIHLAFAAVVVAWSALAAVLDKLFGSTENRQ